MSNVYDSIPDDDGQTAGNVYDSIPDDEGKVSGSKQTSLSTSKSSDNPSQSFIDSIPRNSTTVGKNINSAADQLHEAASTAYHNTVGGYKALYSRILGKGDGTDDVEQENAKIYHAPKIDDTSKLPGGKEPEEIGGGAFGDSVPQATHMLAEKAVDKGHPGLATALESSPTAIQGVASLAGMVPRQIEQVRSAPSLETETTMQSLPASSISSPQKLSAPGDSRQSMGAAQVNPNPFTLTGQEAGRGSGAFPKVKLAKNSGDVTSDEQSTRASIVREVLNDAGEDAGIRTGVLTGNEQTLRSEYQAAKNPNQTPANAIMADQISSEQRALPKFAQQRVDATGADPTLTNDYQRGETINNAFYGDEGLKAYLDKQKSKIYQAALEKNGNDQIPIDTTESMFKDPQFAAGAKLMKHEGVVSGAQDLLNLAKNVGFKDPVTGVQYAPGSVASYQAVTKALNKSWTPENSATIGKINGAINDDIAKSGGGDLYQLGNKIHSLDKGLLSDSAGISDVFGKVDPNGIQTGKDFDNIPKSLNNMPLDQWRHIHDTLDNLSRGQIRGAPEGMDPVPQDLQQAAARAKAEMHGALAREVYVKGAGNAGGWSAHKANETLNGRVGQKILDSFDPDEIRKFQTLNAAGHIMPGAHPYEGAGAQTARMGNEPGFVENYAPKAGVLLGAKTMIPGAPLLGEKIGEKISGMTKGRREANQAAIVSKTLRDNLNRADGGRVGRASGGRVDEDALVERLIKRWKSAKRATDADTKQLLNQPDAAVIRALEISQAHI